jgi:hypothetical protein
MRISLPSCLFLLEFLAKYLYVFFICSEPVTSFVVPIILDLITVIMLWNCSPCNYVHLLSLFALYVQIFFSPICSLNPQYMMNNVFWCVTSCSQVDVYLHFRARSINIYQTTRQYNSEDRTISPSVRLWCYGTANYLKNLWNWEKYITKTSILNGTHKDHVMSPDTYQSVT